MAESQLDPGKFYGKVLGEHQGQDLILSELKHEGARSLPKHAHELAYFCLLINGSYSEHFGTKVIRYKPMTIVFHPPGLVHRDQIQSGGGHFFSVEIRQQWLERLHEYTGRSATSMDLHGGELVWLGARLYREYKELSAYSPLAIEGLMLEMLSQVGRAQKAMEKQEPDWLARVIDLLHSEFQDRLTLDYVAGAVGVHPLHLSKVFRQFRNEGIGDYTHRLRIQFSCQQLSDPRTELGDVALAAGFADQSHFTRVFKHFTGLTPGAFRASLGLTAKTSVNFRPKL